VTAPVQPPLHANPRNMRTVRMVSGKLTQVQTDQEAEYFAESQEAYLRQTKFTDNGSDVALAKGTEMLLVRAEAALRSNNITGAYAFMNQARAVYGMDPLPVAGDMTAAWVDLHFERGATLWLEGRRFEDLRRWYADTGAAHNATLEGRAKCVPISEAEKKANPNFRG